MRGWHRWLPLTWSVLLAVLLLGPGLGPGYLLSYDMVWVPDLALRPDFLGLGSGLPRAVPSDAVVAVLDELVPGWALQRLVLLGALVGGGLGAARWAPPGSVTGRLVAVSVYQWNPLAAERLLLGHWPVLVGYAVLPWAALAARRWRRGTGGPALLLLVPLGSLSISAGLATALVVLAFGWHRRPRRDAALAALLLAGNAPWLVTGLLHASAATTDEAGARLFALGGTDSLPAPLAALGLGGTWNSEVLLPSRDGPLAWLWLVLLAAGVAAGWRGWRARTDRRDATAFLLCWAVGLALALLTWAAPDAVAWLGANVPGAGVLRDGARQLVLCAPLLAALVAHGAGDAQRWLPADRLARTVLAGVLVVLPVTVLPDAAWGLSGRLRPATFPTGWAQARAEVARLEAAGQAGDVLVLPLSSYRQPDWSPGPKVLDPLGRYLTPDHVASDELVVSGVTIAGEDPRVRRVAAALGLDSPDARARALAAEGVGFVAVSRDAPGPAPEVAGRMIVANPDLLVRVLEDVRARRLPPGWSFAAGAAWAAYGGLLLAGTLLTVRSGWARGGQRPPGRRG